MHRRDKTTNTYKNKTENRGGGAPLGVKGKALHRKKAVSADEAEPKPWRLRRGGTWPGGGELARQRFGSTFVATKVEKLIRLNSLTSL